MSQSTSGGIMKMPKGFDFSRTYYLAGPMTNYPEFNYPAFARNQADLQEDGVNVKSPHTIPWPSQILEDDALWQAMMRQALAMLLDCTGIILMRGWTESRGALVEYNIAVALKMPVYFLDGKYLVAMHDNEKDPISL